MEITERSHDERGLLRRIRKPDRDRQQGRDQGKARDIRDPTHPIRRCTRLRSQQAMLIKIRVCILPNEPCFPTEVWDL